MLLEGSCHCKSVKFSVHSPHPYPYNLCYCSICRKTAGGGGFAINLGAANDSLKVVGEEHLSIYQPLIENEETGQLEQNPGRRYFCKHCGSALWQWDPRWPGLVHPFASAIDTELPRPPERTHLMLGSKAGWVEVQAGSNDLKFDEYPQESIAAWHQRLGLEDKDT